MPDKQEIPELKHLQPGQYISWVRKAEDPEWDEEDRPRSKPEKAAASLALELRDAFERISTLAHQLSQEKERNVELLKKLEAPNPHVGKCLECGGALDRPQSIGYCTPCFRVWLKEIDTKPTIED